MKLKRVQPQNIDSLLENLNCNSDKLIETAVLNRLRSNWVDIIGPVYCNQTYPNKYYNSTLWIRVTHPAYKMELSFMEKGLIFQINKLFNRKLVHKINCSIGEVSGNYSVKKEDQGTFEGKENLLSIVDLETDKETKERLIKLVKKFK